MLRKIRSELILNLVGAKKNDFQFNTNFASKYIVLGAFCHKSKFFLF
jgi:hypothetical protein